MGVGGVAIAGGATATAISLSSGKKPEVEKNEQTNSAQTSLTEKTVSSQSQSLNGDSRSDSHQPTTSSVSSTENLGSHADSASSRDSAPAKEK